ncbi:hypothetical protein LUX32_11595 [Actinomadura madurae]|nr:hypothetical protein [Actinomadura madurae]
MAYAGLAGLQPIAGLWAMAPPSCCRPSSAVGYMAGVGAVMIIGQLTKTTGVTTHGDGALRTELGGRGIVFALARSNRTCSTTCGLSGSRTRSGTACCSPPCRRRSPRSNAGATSTRHRTAPSKRPDSYKEPPPP